MTKQQKTTFLINKKMLKAKEEKIRFRFLIFSVILIALISSLYYTLIGLDNFPIFILMTIAASSILIYSVYGGLKSARRMWETFYIKLNVDDIAFCYDKPIYGEFVKTNWVKANQSMSWKNIILKTGRKMILIDKTKLIFGSTFFGKGGLVIPKEIEDFELLISEIKKRIAES